MSRSFWIDGIATFTIATSSTVMKNAAPTTAMGSALLLYLERVLAVFAILLFLLVFLYRSLVHGELPRAVSGRGAEWADLADSSSLTSSELQTQVDELRDAIAEIRETLGEQQ